MTSPVGPALVESEMLRFSALLEERTDEHARHAQEAARAEAAYKSALHKNLLRAPGSTVGDRTAWAEDQCEELFLQRRVAEALRDSALESCRSLRAQLSALQSIGANLRAQMDLSRGAAA